MSGWSVVKVLAWTVAGGCFVVWGIVVQITSGLEGQLVLAPMPWTVDLTVAAVLAVAVWVLAQLGDAGPDFEVSGGETSVIITRVRRRPAFAVVHGAGRIGSDDIAQLWTATISTDMQPGQRLVVPAAGDGAFWIAWIDRNRLRSPKLINPGPGKTYIVRGHASGRESAE